MKKLFGKLLDNVNVFSPADVKKRGLFKGIAPPEKKNKKTLSQTASELLAGYSLKGILIEDTPQAIIEDKKTKQT